MTRRLRIIISAEGATTLKVEGVKGPSCTGVSHPFADGLGEVTKDLKTGEYFQPATVKKVELERQKEMV